MVNRLILTALLFMLAQTVLMGVGVLVILTTPLADHALNYFVPMVEGSAVISLVASFLLAPFLRARNEAA